MVAAMADPPKETRRDRFLESRKRSKRVMSDYSAEVGERIVLTRKELGITQEELAELAGVSQRSMQAYETGEVIPYRKMRELAAVLEVSPAFLLHGEAANEEVSSREIAKLRHEIETLTKLVRAMNRKLDRS